MGYAVKSAVKGMMKGMRIGGDFWKELDAKPQSFMLKMAMGALDCSVIGVLIVPWGLKCSSISPIWKEP